VACRYATYTRLIPTDHQGYAMKDQHSSVATPSAYTDNADVANFINGSVVASTGDRKQAVYNPSTGSVARQVVLSTVEDVQTAVAAAKAAAPAWADTPPVRRARIINRFLGLMNDNIDTMAAMITAEHGKVFTDAQGEV